MQINQNIRRARLSKGFSQEKMAKLLGEKRSTYAEWENEIMPKAHILAKISSITEIPMDDLLAESVNRGTSEVSESESESYVKGRSNKKLSREAKRTIPFYDAPGTATMTETEMTAIHAPAGTIDVGDLLNDSQAAIRIYGNSMMPNYPPGCVVGLRRVGVRSIQPGEVYVIETKDSRLLKRLFYVDDDPKSDSIYCYSDNVMRFEGGTRNGKFAYPPSILHKEDIVHIFVVTGVIKRNENSVIINRAI